MTTQMIPCANPGLCGVKQHRPGTEARCKATTTAGTRRGDSRLQGAPRPATPAQAVEHQPVSAADVSELLAEAASLSEEVELHRAQGTAQIIAGVRRDLKLTDEDAVSISSHSLMYPNDKVTVEVNAKVSWGPRRYVDSKSRHLPAQPSEGVTSMADIRRLDAAVNDMAERRELMAQAGHARVEAWVEDWVKTSLPDHANTPRYDRVRTHPDNVIGEDRTVITANMYLRDSFVATHRIPATDIFPE